MPLGRMQVELLLRRLLVLLSEPTFLGFSERFIHPRQVRGFLLAVDENNCDDKRNQAKPGIMRALTPDPCSAASRLDCWLLLLP